GDVSNETEGGQQGQAQAVDQTIQLYLVALEDNGQGGQQVGCGDSLVPVNKTLHTATPLADAVRELLAIKDEHYGQSGLYNSLWKSSVHLDSASISNGVATVKLSGDLTLSGECDNPRVLEQLKATITQFDSVNSATILLNDQPLSEALALQ